jgi:hypothetical protein
MYSGKIAVPPGGGGIRKHNKMPQIKKCCVIDCSSSGLTKKTSFHCFPANLELNLQWKEALINHAGSTISMIFF